MSGKIYAISLHGRPVYVGFTSQTIEQRFREHCRHALGKRHSKLYSAMRKYGIEAFTIQLITEHEDEDYALNVLEPLYIAAWGTQQNAYNMTHGSDKPPPTTKRGKDSPNWGKKLPWSSVIKREATRKAKHDDFIANELAKGTKVCSECRIEKPFADFGKCSGERLGLRWMCKECRNRKQRAYKKSKKNPPLEAGD